MSPYILILIGNIGSGKSTFTRQLVQAEPEKFLVINDDSLVSMLHGGVYSLHTDKLKPLYKNIEYNIICNAVTMNYNVIIDRPNMSKLNRQSYISIARSLNINIFYKEFERVSPEEHAKRRISSDGRGIDYDKWLMIANKFHNEYEKITIDENINEFNFN